MERDSEIVKDAVLISQLYQCSVHVSGDLFRLFEPLIGKKSIQYANGPEGRKRRQLMDRSFSHEAVKDYYDHFVKVLYNFCLVHTLFNITRLFFKICFCFIDKQYQYPYCLPCISKVNCQNLVLKETILS